MRSSKCGFNKKLNAHDFEKLIYIRKTFFTKFMFISIVHGTLKKKSKTFT